MELEVFRESRVLSCRDESRKAWEPLEALLQLQGSWKRSWWDMWGLCPCLKFLRTSGQPQLWDLLCEGQQQGAMVGKCNLWHDSLQPCFFAWSQVGVQLLSDKNVNVLHLPDISVSAHWGWRPQETELQSSLLPLCGKLIARVSVVLALLLASRGRGAGCQTREHKQAPVTCWT